MLERGGEAAGRVNTMAAAFCVDCGLQLTGTYCGACGRDYGATDAAQRASCSLATVQQDSSSTAGAQREVAEAQQDVSSSTAGAQRAVSPTSRPCAREGGGREHGAPRPVKTWHFTQEYARSREVDGNSAFIGSGKKKMTTNLIYHI